MDSFSLIQPQGSNTGVGLLSALQFIGSRSRSFGHGELCFELNSASLLEQEITGQTQIFIVRLDKNFVLFFIAST